MAAGAVVVVLRTEHRLLNEIGAELWRHGERRLVGLKSALEDAGLILEDLHAGMSLQLSMQVGLCQVSVSLLQRLPLSLVLAKEIVWARAVKLPDSVLDVCFLLSACDLSNSLLVVLGRLLWLLFLLLFLLLAEETAKE